MFQPGWICQSETRIPRLTSPSTSTLPTLVTTEGCPRQADTFIQIMAPARKAEVSTAAVHRRRRKWRRRRKPAIQNFKHSAPSLLKYFWETFLPELPLPAPLRYLSPWMEEAERKASRVGKESSGSSSSSSLFLRRMMELRTHSARVCQDITA